MSDQKNRTFKALEKTLDKYSQRIENLTSEKLALCDANDALTEENLKLRKELADYTATVDAKRRRFSEVSASIGRKEVVE